MFAQTVTTGAVAFGTVALGLLGAFGRKVFELTKNVTNRRWDAVAAQVVAWALFVAVLVVASRARLFATSIEVPGTGTDLGHVDVFSLVLLGLGLGSGYGVFGDYLKARDNTQTAAQPPLFPPSTPDTPAPAPDVAGGEPWWTPDDSPPYVPGADGNPVPIPLDEGGDLDDESPEEAARRRADFPD